MNAPAGDDQIRPLDPDIEAALAAVEEAMGGQREVDLGRLGFWRAVAAVKRNPDLVERYADRIGTIDQQAFRSQIRATVSVGGGATVLGFATLVGLVVVGVAYRLEDPWNGLFVLAGTGILLGTTHGLSHLVVGTAVGMRFTGWFLGGPTRLQPGLKIDYASYLRTPPRSRAWMHASGALVTKLIPFAMLGAAWAAGTPRWTSAALLAIGVVQILTDALYSTKQSDWKRFRREMSLT